MTFDLQYTDPKSNARAGLITTDHGQIETPIFMPVGTLGTVKGVHLHELKEDKPFSRHIVHQVIPPIVMPSWGVFS